MKYIYGLLYLYLLLKPYYIFKSGSLQIGDFLLLLAFLLLILISKTNKEPLKKAINKNKYFLFFIGLVFAINLIYFFIYYKFKFILSSLYYIFNFLAIILFSVSFQENKKFILNMNKIFKFNLILQFIFSLLSIGKMYGTYRWMGTFNDPNQFGYYIFICFSFIYLIDNKKSFIYFLISIYLIFKCSSTGMLLGFCVFIFLFLLNSLKGLTTIMYKNMNKILLIFFFFISLCAIYCISGDINSKEKNKVDISEQPIIARFTDKIDRVSKKDNTVNTSEMSIWQERGYDKIYLYPQYLLFGAGEGEYTRFIKAAHMGEIHATFPSIMFYYGIIPTIILCIWIFSNIKHATSKEFVIYISLFVESFFLLNQRQSLFWIIIIFASFNTFKRKKT